MRALHQNANSPDRLVGFGRAKNEISKISMA